MFEKIKRLHFVGIGGSGMSGIAEVFHNLGYVISGSDTHESVVLKRLRSLGVKIYIQHNKNNIAGVHVVITSTAISPVNPEVRAARKKGIPVIPRIEMLAELARLKYTVSVAGTHGKTTTTSMLAIVLQKGGFDPTIVIGGILKNIGTGAKLGKGNYLIAEADESDGSFLKLSPTIVVVTNIDDDHLDYYGSMKKLLAAFVEHCNRIPFYGTAVVFGDDSNVRKILPLIHRKVVTFGFGKSNVYRIERIEHHGYSSSFILRKQKKLIGKVRINVPGRHNVIDSAAAAVAGIEMGIPFSKVRSALYEFSGVKRRLEIKGVVRGITVVDDYGHHPTEVDAVLKTLRQTWPKNRVYVLFQPHRYTRTKLLYKEFARVLQQADVVRLLDIYPAAEKPIPGIHSRLIVEILKKKGIDSCLMKAQDTRLLQDLKPNDIFLTLGAGPVWQTGEWVIRQNRG